LNKRGVERHLHDSYKVSRGNERRFPNREEPRLQTICEPCRHSIHRLVRRQLHKAGIGATTAIGLLSLRETQSVPGKLPPILRQQRPIHMDLSRAECLECGAFSAATTGNVLPSWLHKHFVGRCLPLRNTYPVSATADTPLHFSRVDASRLPASVQLRRWRASCRVPQHELQVSAPSAGGWRTQTFRPEGRGCDVGSSLPFRRIKPGFLNLREADLPTDY
jgi:hypothetical protein